MQAYIGAKIIQAEPMYKKAFLRENKGIDIPEEDDQRGYRVVYPDGYVSWSPKDVFESAYRHVSPQEAALIS